MPVAIELHNLSKAFIIKHNKADQLKSKFIGLFYERYRERRELFWALKNVDLSIQKGETCGIIGPNGSGKSTLLRIIAHVLTPTSGTVSVYGRVAPMIELGVGFHHELTGKENVYLNASLFGLSRKEIDSIYDKIVTFSELQDLIDVPIKNYSSGMFMRLGFSVAMHLSPEIFLIDEIFAVGDENFQRKCIEKVNELKRGGTTILFISHSLDSIERICDRVYLLERGEIVTVGEAREVIDRYKERVVQSSRSDRQIQRTRISE